jgi:hypothetical protein
LFFPPLLPQSSINNEITQHAAAAAAAAVAAWPQEAQTSCLQPCLQQLPPASSRTYWTRSFTTQPFTPSFSTILQLPPLTWRFCCTCIALVAALGYVLLGALQMASARPRAAPEIDAAAAAADISKSEGHDDDSDDADNVETEHGESAQSTGPQGGAGAVADAAALMTTNSDA